LPGSHIPHPKNADSDNKKSNQFQVKKVNQLWNLSLNHRIFASPKKIQRKTTTSAFIFRKLGAVSEKIGQGEEYSSWF